MLKNVRRNVSWLVPVAVLALGLPACKDGGGSAGGRSTQSGTGGVPPAPRVAKKVHGLNLGPYVRPGQDPDFGTRLLYVQTARLLDTVKPYTVWVRFYGASPDLVVACRQAKELGLKVVAAAWLGKAGLADAANEGEIGSVIALALEGLADVVLVGSEVLLRGDQTPSNLVKCIRRVRDAVPTAVSVGTADVDDLLISHPEVIEACDLLFVNIYPFWAGVRIDQAAAYLHQRYQDVLSAAGGRQVVLSETGWPSCGNPVGFAEPSSENAAFYFLNVVSWARANEIAFFYFEAFDEPWKRRIEGLLGGCWGIFTSEGELKEGMQAVFDGQTLPDNWGGEIIPGGPGDPSLQFTFVPPHGSHADLAGRVLHVPPLEHRVAVYIFVLGAWWTKPYWDRPTTPVRPDGSWTCDVTTGGVDQLATRIAAFLIPASYSPPLARGTSSVLPVELDEESLTSMEVERAP